MQYIYLYLILLLFSAISFTYYMLNSYSSVSYRDDQDRNCTIDKDKVTIGIPVYNENVDTFRNVIKAVVQQGVKFVVVGDSSNQPYRSITEKNGGKFVLSVQRGGKRRALSLLLEHIDTDYVMFVDSDTIVPAGAVESMLSLMGDNVGGVGTNIAIRNNKSNVYYSAEFLERAREVVFRAMSHHGNVMVLDGRCALYRTSIVRPLIQSNAFMYNKVLGKKSVMGDDRQITSYITKNGYKALKDYSVTVYTDPPADYSQFVKQQIRWSRVGWTHFFKEIFNGTAKKAGAFYTFEMVYMYLLPLLVVLLSLFRLYLEFSVHRQVALNTLSQIEDLLLLRASHDAYIGFAKAMLFVMNVVGNLVFLGAITAKINRERLKTIAFGSVALGIMFATTLYGLVTFWKQKTWLTR